MHKLLLVAALFLSSAAYAADAKIGLMASFLYNVPDKDESGPLDSVSETSKPGWGFGMRGLVPLSNNVYFRSGAGLAQKFVGFEAEAANQNNKADLSFLYLNIPATFYFTGMDQKLGFFGGTALNARLTDDCESDGPTDLCKNFDPSSIVLPVVVGFDFIFHENFSMELSYEYGIMNTARDLKVSSAVLSFILNY